MDVPGDKIQRRSAARFGTTQWSLILSAADRSSPQWRQSMAELCRQYWAPLYAFVRRQGRPPAEAEDLTQGFLLLLLDKDYLAATGPEKGRFRSFLLMCLKRYLANENDYRSAQKRGGDITIIPLDRQGIDSRLLLEPVDSMTPDVIYERQWAFALLEAVFERLSGEYRAAGKEQLFGELKSFLVGEDSDQTQADLAGRLGVSAAAIKVAIHRMRRRYGELLRREIARTVLSPEDVESEIRQLFSALRAAR